MFTIVISEKGGTERREACDKNEINVGRVQGNDLMLPKGNVSKHHARLLYRDGRFIVTDLKSTNGTYVNGRKISQATIVREGDKIYVGDFVLRLETGPKSATDFPYSEEEPAAGPPPSSGRSTGAREPGTIAQPGAPPSRGPPSPPVVALAAAAAVSAPAAFAPHPSEPDNSVERDADAESATKLRNPAARLPLPPRVPNPLESRGNGGTVHAGDRRAAPGAPFTSSAPPRAARSIPPPALAAARPGPQETQKQATRRLALITLVDRVADVVDLSAFERTPVGDGAAQSIERAVRDQAQAMRQEGEAPEGIDLDLLVREALREIVGLGPLGPLLDDEETNDIHVVRHDYVLASKSGEMALAETPFTSEEALARVVARLAHQAGNPIRAGELVIDRRLSRGAMMTAIAPPAASAWVLRVRKRRRVEGSLAELVASGAMSESVGAFLEASAAARANVIVVGPGGEVVPMVLGAIASAAPAGERVAVLHDGTDEFLLPRAHAVILPINGHSTRGQESVYAAARLGVDRIVVTSLTGAMAMATIDVIAEGCEGVLAGVSGPSLRHALARLVSQVALARTGSSLDAARNAIAESFDVVVEVERATDGRLRVLRVAEFDGNDERGVTTRDLFVLSVDAEGLPTYRATGASSRMAQDFGARSLKFDAAKRQSAPSEGALPKRG